MSFWHAKWKVLHKQKQRVRTIAIGLTLLFALLTPSLRFVLSEPLTCGMECCLESGECCCLVRLKSEHFSEDEDHEEAPIINQATLAKDCSQNCAAPSSYSPTFTHKAERANSYNFNLTAINSRPHEKQRFVVTYDLIPNISPRGPPSTFINNSL